MHDRRLQLTYVFTPSPNPIRASVGHAPANKVDLQVMISNEGPDPVVLQTIRITIPVGQEGAPTLSDSPALPAPEYDQTSGWKIANPTDSVVTLTLPPKGLLDSFLFTLPGIVVNDTFGSVPLTIEELAPPAPKVTDGTTYALIKYKADFPVTAFYAQPATLNNLGETVTLHWVCSDQGAQYVYSVHSDSWRPDDCVNGGQCFSCADGQQGVVSPQLQETTTFSLDVIETDPQGGRKNPKTLTTTVPVLLPSIWEPSLQTYFGGRYVLLYWLAHNAAKCTVYLEGNPIDNDAPTDTYPGGYPVTKLFDQTGEHILSVTADSELGAPPASFNFLPVSISQSTISVGQLPNAVAVTPDGKLALVANGFGNSVSFIDVASGAVVNTVAIDGGPWAVAVTPDGKLALVVNFNGGSVSFIDVASRAVVNTVKVDQDSSPIAVTPDGKLALVVNFNGNSVSFIDVASRAVVNTVAVGGGPNAVAVTPDGTLALVTNYTGGSVSFIEVESRAVVNTVTVGGGPSAVAVTPDGKLALVVGFDGGSVSFIDVASRAVVNTVAVGQHPCAVAVMPHGRLAFVANHLGNTVSVIDVPSRKAVSDFQVGSQPTDVAFTPDGRHALITLGASNAVVIM